MQQNSEYNNVRREVVVNSMTRKLAEHGKTPQNSVKYKKLFIILPITTGIVVFFFIVLLLIRPDTNEYDQIDRSVANAFENPLSKLRKSMNEGNLSTDQYAVYLGYVLFRYDSLPEVFKADRPVIRALDVYDELENVWPRVGKRTKEYLQDNIPDLQLKMEGG
jgi:hypothetical protein